MVRSEPIRRTDVPTKMCTACGEIKNVSEFYPLAAGRVGLQDACKPCFIARVARAREAKPELYREYQHARERHPERVEYKNRQKRAEKLKKSELMAARSAWRRALRSGALVRNVCEVCLNPNTYAFCEDLSKPLEVRWFCPKHHAAHRSNRNL